MFCSRCGASNDKAAPQCVQCGANLDGDRALLAASSLTKVDIPNYLVPSIVVTLLCCMPVGIAAIIFAVQVNNKILAGDIDGALESSKRAKILCWVSFGMGLLVSAAYFVGNAAVILHNQR